jgi:hypothetical protein
MSPLGRSSTSMMTKIVGEELVESVGVCLQQGGEEGRFGEIQGRRACLRHQALRMAGAAATALTV